MWENGHSWWNTSHIMFLWSWASRDTKPPVCLSLTLLSSEVCVRCVLLKIHNPTTPKEHAPQENSSDCAPTGYLKLSCFGRCISVLAFQSWGGYAVWVESACASRLMSELWKVIEMLSLYKSTMDWLQTRVTPLSGQLSSSLTSGAHGTWLNKLIDS